MSEIRRRRMAQQDPRLQVPVREDAMIDRDAERLQGMLDRTAPVNVPMPGVNTAQMDGMPVSAAGGGAGNLPQREMRPVRDGGAEEAYQLGMRMGAKSMAGTMDAEDAMKGAKPVNEDRLIEAEKLLMKYKSGKASVDKRIIAAQDWWKLRNWAQIESQRGTQGATVIKSATAWLWNCIVSKHADAMNSFPEPVVLPRMEEDKAEAEILSEVLPVVLKMNGFEDEYDREQWQKNQEGTGAYHVGWDKTKLGGLGDISIKNVSMLNLYWEPGVEDIEESQNLFYVQLVDQQQLEGQYPELRGRLKNSYLKPAEYRKDDSVTVDGKCVLVDWYYHSWYGPRKVVHYCQFVNHIVLYSTENNGEPGIYEDGEYPFALDVLYPVHGSPAGYGMIDIGRDAQTDIDTLNQAMVLNAVVTSTPRYFIQTDGQINEEEFANWSKPFVHTGGGLGEQSLRQINVSGIQGSALEMLTRKIDELKFVTGNTDVNNGGTPSGVTAASAIAALQEQSGRGSKDSNRGSYRCFNKLCTKVISRMRQFYDIPRWFRILGKDGQEKYVQYSNANLKDQQLAGGMNLAPGLRHPVFDIDVRSERETSYTKLSQNELMIQMYNMGAFNPQNTDSILMMMEGMDFRGREEMINRIRQQGTMLDALVKVSQIALALSAKYDPQITMQLAPILQQIGMDAAGGGTPTENAGGLTAAQVNNVTGRPSDEAANVRKARAQVEESTMPQ